MRGLELYAGQYLKLVNAQQKEANPFQPKTKDVGFEKALLNLKGPISSEISGAINSINNLLKSEIEAADSNALQALDQYFGRLAGDIAKMNSETAPDLIPNMLSLISQMEFYTSKSNAGSGYDSILEFGGARSPSAYLKRIKTYIQNLNKYLPKKEDHIAMMSNQIKRNVNG